MFILNSLDLMNVLEEKIPETERKHIVDWVYAQQVLPVENNQGKSIATNQVKITN
jgi:hypothetical protein